MGVLPIVAVGSELPVVSVADNSVVRVKNIPRDALGLKCYSITG